MEDISVRKHIKQVLDKHFNASLFSDIARLNIATEILEALKLNDCLNSKLVDSTHLKHQSISSVDRELKEQQVPSTPVKKPVKSVKKIEKPVKKIEKPVKSVKTNPNEVSELINDFVADNKNKPVNKPFVNKSKKTKKVKKNRWVQQNKLNDVDESQFSTEALNDRRKAGFKNLDKKNPLKSNLPKSTKKLKPGKKAFNKIKK